MEQLRLYQIDMKYVRDLHNADDRVESVSPQIGKASRVFVGVVITHNNRKYCIPLSHPKEKHKKMANNAELQKIEVEGKIIGVLNFNLMIPITDKQLTPVDLKIHNNDNFTVKAWKKLCIKELKWCRQHEIIISGNLCPFFIQPHKTVDAYPTINGMVTMLSSILMMKNSMERSSRFFESFEKKIVIDAIGQAAATINDIAIV